MPGLGTVINAIAILVGGIFGLLFGRILKKNVQDMLVSCCGLSVIFIGAGGALEKMFSISDGKISSGGAMIIIVSLCLGGLIGEIIGFEEATERLGEWLKKKTGNSSDDSFVSGFVNASITVCIGAMAIIGPINDVLYGDISILLAKSLLDGIIIMAMVSSSGKGAIFSVIPVVLIQGFFSLCAKLIEPVLTEASLANLSLVGSILIFGVGVNLAFGKKFKVANLLPSLIIAIIWGLI